MSRSLSQLRRGLLGIAVAGSLGLGATQVVAKPKVSRFEACTPGMIGEHKRCNSLCSPSTGHCDWETAECWCRPLS